MRSNTLPPARSAGSEPPGSEVSILLVDDDIGAIRLMERILADVGTLRFATNGKDALRLAQEDPPDLILLDAEMPGMSGFELLEAIRADWSLSEVPVLVVTSHSEAEFEVSALQLGASDFITKPYRPPAVMARVKTQLRIKQLSDELRRAATTDDLTGLANRRHFDEYLAREWRRAGRAGDPMSLLMIDVDHFKLFNDHYGHPRGDVCLRQVAEVLAGACHRPADFVARYGGEEFVILLPQTPRAGAELLAARVLDSMQAVAMAHAHSPTATHVTLSIGVASIDSVHAQRRFGEADGASRSDGLRMDTARLIRAADQALYLAKGAGRARCHFRDFADAS